MIFKKAAEQPVCYRGPIYVIKQNVTKISQTVVEIWRFTHTHTHNRLMAFVRDNPGRPVPEETCTRSHPSWSTYFLYHLSHLCSLKCHQVFFPYRLGLTSLQHAASHTTTIQPSCHNQRHILIGKQWYQLLACMSSISICCRILYSKILSTTFIACSNNLIPLYDPHSIGLPLPL